LPARIAGYQSRGSTSWRSPGSSPGVACGARAAGRRAPRRSPSCLREDPRPVARPEPRARARALRGDARTAARPAPVRGASFQPDLVRASASCRRTPSRRSATSSRWARHLRRLRGPAQPAVTSAARDAGIPRDRRCRRGAGSSWPRRSRARRRARPGALCPSAELVARTLLARTGDRLPPHGAARAHPRPLARPAPVWRALEARGDTTAAASSAASRASSSRCRRPWTLLRSVRREGAGAPLVRGRLRPPELRRDPDADARVPATRAAAWPSDALVPPS
jgi:hypothetical protein